jgi:opacity protein-like surface antigen
MKNKILGAYIIMKWIFTLIVLFFVHTSTYADVIYGIDRVSRYKQPIIKPLYVQMGSFSTPTAATTYQQYLKTRTTCNVLVISSADSYKVRVGPFSDDASLALFEKQFSNTSSISPSRLPLASVSNSATWFVNGQVGGQKMSLHDTAMVNNGSGFASPLGDDIYTMNRTSTTTLLGIQAGRRFELTLPWFSAFSLGTQYQYFFNSHIDGQVIQFSLPQFTNYNYTWKTTSNLVIANGKLNFIELHRVSTYINGGIGVAIKNSRGYSETALEGVTPRISPNFNAGSNSDFAYILGAGVDYRLNPVLIISLGYQYSNLGELSAGAGTGAWSSQSLNLGNTQSNAVLLGLTYLIDTKLDIKHPTTK